MELDTTLTCSEFIFNLVGGVRGPLDGSNGADGRLPLLVAWGELLGGEAWDGEGGRGLFW